MPQQRREASANSVGAPPKLTDEVRERLLEALRGGLSRQDASALVGLDRSTLYRTRRADPAFAIAVNQAEAETTRVCLDVIWRSV